MAKTICDNCIHDGVCGLEGHLDEALTFCANKSTDVPMKCGHWVDAETGNKLLMKCSECGQNLVWLNFSYCPYCGADMREEN